MSDAVSANALWSTGDRARLGLSQLAGAVMIGASWFFAAGRADAGDQLVFVSLAVAGALVGLGGVAGWAVRGRRGIRGRLAVLLGDAPAIVATTVVPVAADLVAGSGGKWFHRADCLLVEGRGWPVSSPAAHQRAGRRACPACKP